MITGRSSRRYTTSVVLVDACPSKREDALAAIEEAVTIRRELAAARPDAFRPDLALSLNNPSNRAPQDAHAKARSFRAAR